MKGITSRQNPCGSACRNIVNWVDISDISTVSTAVGERWRAIVGAQTEKNDGYRTGRPHRRGIVRSGRDDRCLDEKRERLRCTLRDVFASIELWKAKKMHLQAIQMSQRRLIASPSNAEKKPDVCRKISLGGHWLRGRTESSFQNAMRIN